MKLSHADTKRLQAVALAHPMRGGNDQIHASTNRDRRSGLSVLLSVNH